MVTASINEICSTGLYVGAGITVIPALATFVIASSKTIMIEYILNRIFGYTQVCGKKIRVTGLALIQVPLLWKISKVSAIIGISIIATSLLTMLVSSLYNRLMKIKNS